MKSRANLVLMLTVYGRSDNETDGLMTPISETPVSSKGTDAYIAALASGHAEHHGPGIVEPNSTSFHETGVDSSAVADRSVSGICDYRAIATPDADTDGVSSNHGNGPCSNFDERDFNQVGPRPTALAASDCTSRPTELVTDAAARPNDSTRPCHSGPSSPSVERTRHDVEVEELSIYSGLWDAPATIFTDDELTHQHLNLAHAAVAAVSQLAPTLSREMSESASAWQITSTDHQLSDMQGPSIEGPHAGTHYPPTTGVPAVHRWASANRTEAAVAPPPSFTSQKPCLDLRSVGANAAVLLENNISTLTHPNRGLQRIAPALPQEAPLTHGPPYSTHMQEYTPIETSQGGHVIKGSLGYIMCTTEDRGSFAVS
jgi:hypothetical protein